jgi:hypothetical protein
LARRTLYGDIYVELGVGRLTEDEGQSLSGHEKERQFALVMEAQEVVTGKSADGKDVTFGGWGTRIGSRILDKHAEWAVKTNQLSESALDRAVATVVAEYTAEEQRAKKKKEEERAQMEPANDPDLEDENEESISNHVPSIVMEGNLSTEPAVLLDDDGKPIEFDDDELNSFILTDEEKKKKAAIWDKMHQPYLEARAKKKAEKQSEARDREYRREQNRNQDRGSRGNRKGKRVTEGEGESEPAPKSSKINYQALEASLNVELNEVE